MTWPLRRCALCARLRWLRRQLLCERCIHRLAAKIVEDVVREKLGVGKGTVVH
jgi:hypothetical protein